MWGSVGMSPQLRCPQCGSVPPSPLTAAPGPAAPGARICREPRRRTWGPRPTALAPQQPADTGALPHGPRPDPQPQPHGPKPDPQPQPHSLKLDPQPHSLKPDPQLQPCPMAPNLPHSPELDPQPCPMAPNWTPSPQPCLMAPSPMAVSPTLPHSPKHPTPLPHSPRASPECPVPTFTSILPPRPPPAARGSSRPLCPSPLG